MNTLHHSIAKCHKFHIFKVIFLRNIRRITTTTTKKLLQIICWQANIINVIRYYACMYNSVYGLSRNQQPIGQKIKLSLKNNDNKTIN